MRFQSLIIILCLFNICLCDKDILRLFEEANKDVIKFNAISAEIEWTSSVNPQKYDKIKFEIYVNDRILWQRETCKEMTILRNNKMLNKTQHRQAYLLCGGPSYKLEEVRLLYKINERMKSIYNTAEICIPRQVIGSVEMGNLTFVENNIIEYLSISTQEAKSNNLRQGHISWDNKICLKQKDMEEITAYSRNEQVLRWIWLTWRKKTGLNLKLYYQSMVNIENKAAKENGKKLFRHWSNVERGIGSTIPPKRMPSTVQICTPLYTLLHGVVRYFLRVQYGDIVPELGPIPAHLLGNLWTQNWESLADFIIPNNIDLDSRMKDLNWDVKHMVKRAEDFYQSLTLPPMTDTFWKNSIFSDKGNSNARCHGTAADMFKKDDYRMLYCSGVSMQDFNVIHHEMGHIQYYMAYENQPGLFRQANSAFHESVGEAIMIGVLTPQHLNRLGLINDSLLYSIHKEENKETVPSELIKEDSNDQRLTPDSVKERTKVELLENVTTDEILLLKRALSKLPQIPFSLLVDEYRWKYFEGGLYFNLLNEQFWDMALELQGISPPGNRDEELFDAGAIYHVADNTPYIRYFLSNFLQHQLFEHFCKVSIYGNQRAKEPLPETMNLNRCDIYGSKAAGKVLKKFMSYGHSQTWQDILKKTMDQDKISPEPLLRYYEPLHKLLTKVVETYKIPLGWQSYESRK